MNTKYVNGLTHKGNSTQLWRTIKGLSSATDKRSPNQAIFFDGNKSKPYYNPKKCADKFNQQYTPHPPKPDIKRRNTLREFQKLKVEEHHISEKAVGHAIKQTSKS